MNPATRCLLPCVASLLLTATSQARQVHFGVDMREGANGVLTPVSEGPNSSITAFDCISLGLPYGVGTVELQYDLNADFNVSLVFNWTDTPSEVLTNGCPAFYAGCPTPTVGTCGPQVTQRLDYGVVRGSMSLYSAAGGGGISGGATYTRIAQGTIDWHEPLDVYSSVARSLRLPVTVSGTVTAAESFGDPIGTWGKAELMLTGSVLGQPVNLAVSVESVSTIPEQDSISQTIDVIVPVSSGHNSFAIDLSGQARVEARAQSAGLFGTIVGAATAIADFPSSIKIGRITLADGSPLPPDVTVVGTLSGIYYEGNVGAANRYCVGAANSVGAGAVIDSTGSLAISDNDLHILVSGAPALQPGLFLYGPTQVQLPFGDGFRCVAASVGMPVVRLGVPLQTDASGVADRLIDFASPPAGSGPGQILPGSTWNFQFWYRDPAGAGGSAFNLSDALSFLFPPG